MVKVVASAITAKCGGKMIFEEGMLLVLGMTPMGAGYMTHLWN